MHDPELSIVMPAYNEGATLTKTVESLSEALSHAQIAYEIVVVNNGSQDETETVLNTLTKKNPRVRALHLSPNRGYGGGVHAGLLSAQGAVIGWIDGDGQSDPHDVAKLYRHMQQERAAFAKAVRVIRTEHWFRRVQSVVFNTFFRMLFGGTLRDINAKPKLVAKEVFDRLDLKKRDWFIDAELVIEVTKQNLPTTEMPVEWLGRAGGKSHVKLGTALEFISNMIQYRFSK